MVVATRNIATVLVGSIALYWISTLYENALRDVRYLDGWILTAGMAAQILFHVRRHFPAHALGSASSWLRFHMVAGYVVVAAFALHTGFSLPDAPFEWVLWCAFVLVAVSGVIGTYLNWLLPKKLSRIGEPIPVEQIPARRQALARDVETLVLQSVERAGASAISELYIDHLQAFFARHRNLRTHWGGSNRHLDTLFVELDRIGAYLDDDGMEVLDKLRKLILRKDGLDHQYSVLSLLHGWLFIHVPATYALVPLTLFHILAAYAFSAGVP